ncbi:hypothetical protein SAMN04489867_3638 [Pedococcus dokdonensis]|uniref:HNH nuclease domain-containing protein n=1 Tax=Pedococcus dokdonensis TaxID=443156 RepID=A0A1H0V2J0_9MICO|nr:HNH endonuclease signature motif containing protein [Pedococcus dokdonensis]SDP72752.1 hypothetical protein SAMN04489867_3638 [Pedococcus dokdonensis]
MFESAEAVAATDPAVLAGVVFGLSDDAIADLPVEQAEALVLATQRVVSAVTARQRSAMETVVRRCDERVEQDARDATAGGSPRGHVSGQALAAGSLAALLHVSPRTMSTRIDQARRLVCALPQVQELAWAGDLEPYRVDAVVAESAAVHAGRLHEFEARVLAGGLVEVSCATLRSRARRAADRCAPHEAAAFAERARTLSDVRVRPGACTGMTRLVADLPTPAAMRLWHAVDGLAGEYARAQPGQPMGAARADALTDLVAANSTISTTIELVAPIDAAEREPRTLDVSGACVADHPTTGTTDDRDETEGDPQARHPAGVGSDDRDETEGDPQARHPAGVGSDERDETEGDPEARHPAGVGSDERDETDGEDEGGQPGGVGGGQGALVFEDPGGCEELDDGVLHDHADRMWFVSSHTEVPLLGSLLPADVVALLSDPDVTVRLSRSDSVTGAIRWQDPNTYRPGARVAKAVRSRDGTCRFPGCATAARRCQLDHVVRHPDGPTSVTNLQSLCATHHGFKHHAGWQVEMDALGTCTWTAPDGRTHTTWPLDRHGHRATAA